MMPKNKSNNLEMTNLHYTVVECLSACEKPLCDAMDAIKRSKLKPNQKNMFMNRFQSIFANSNDIIEQLGRMGKVK